jgi:hypothetical protein
MSSMSYSVTRAAALGHELIVKVQYPDPSGKERNVIRTLVRVTRPQARRPFIEINWLGKHSGLTLEGAQRVLAELDNDCCEDRAKIVDIDDQQVEALRR